MNIIIIERECWSEKKNPFLYGTATVLGRLYPDRPTHDFVFTHPISHYQETQPTNFIIWQSII